jgi:hypothetical protein
MLATPLIVRSLVGSGLQSMAATLGPATVAAMVAAPARAALVYSVGRNGVSKGVNMVSSRMENRRIEKKKQKDMYRY